MRPELKTALRLLCFRATDEEVRALNFRHLVLGLLCTWLVGMGRWWEDPRANWLQHLGIGSVIYVFFLSGFLWFLLWPLAPKSWSLLNVLAFISLTSPPAILYAIPVRHGLELPTAQFVRLWLLAIVAGWRVALLFFYMYRVGFTRARMILATVFPLILIVCTLQALNLEKVVFDFMGGIHKENATVNDAAYGVLFVITLFSVLLFIPLLVSYLIASVPAVLAKSGRRASVAIYGVAVLCIMAGAVCAFRDLTFVAVILAGSGSLMAITTAIEIRRQDREKT